MENKVKIKNDKIFKNDENGFEIHFKLQKFGAYLSLAFTVSFIIVDYVLFRGAYLLGEFAFLLYRPVYAFGFIALKLVVIYTIYLAVYTLKSNSVVKLDNENLSKYSAPIPRIGGNKIIKRNEIESCEVKKLKTTSRASQTSSTQITQTYYNLHIKLKGGKEVKFFTSLTNGDSSLIKRLLDEHLNL